VQAERSKDQVSTLAATTSIALETAINTMAKALNGKIEVLNGKINNMEKQNG